MFFIWPPIQTISHISGEWYVFEAILFRINEPIAFDAELSDDILFTKVARSRKKFEDDETKFLLADHEQKESTIDA